MILNAKIYSYFIKPKVRQVIQHALEIKLINNTLRSTAYHFNIIPLKQRL